ncbi:MAG: metalloregulator ArsR/SmtB family transcription factor [Pseudohongiellaceae bacterium]
MAIAAIRPAGLPVLSDSRQLASVIKALADELRLEILRLLKSESFGVLEICRILDIRQSALSHHLKILATAELLTTRREGNSIFYRRPLILDDDPLQDFKKSAFANIDRLPLPTRVLQRIKVIQQERAQLSLSFFTRHADKFREKQGLVTEYQQYAGSLQDLIKGIGLSKAATVMEVGPGEGELLTRLAKQFNHVIAVDNSKEMLDRARAAIRSIKAENVDFIFGETTTALRRKLHCDLLIFNMVMHHISSPARSFKDAVKLLNKDGVLLVVDLCNHDQDWVRESCGDLWLGFETSDFSGWAAAAGLNEGQSLYLGLRNGFQIQMRLFIKTF